jgi:hypothetical protein
MSYKDQRQDLVPAGSSQDNRSTLDGSNDVPALAIIKLKEISAEINGVVDEAAASMAKAQIKVGRLLNEARALIPGDLQFGKWRELNTTITNKSTANKLMNLARQVGEGRITQDMMDTLPVSTLKELISAPDSVLESVAQAIKENPEAAPTRTDVRELVKAEKVEEVIEEVMAETAAEIETAVSPAPPKKTVAPSAPMAPPRVDTRKAIDDALGKSFRERLKAGKPYAACSPLEWAFIVFGLEPDPASYPSQQVIDILSEAYLDMADAEEHEIILKAQETIMRQY